MNDLKANAIVELVRKLSQTLREWGWQFER